MTEESLITTEPATEESAIEAAEPATEPAPTEPTIAPTEEQPAAAAESETKPKKKPRKALRISLGIGIPVLICALLAGGIYIAHRYYEGTAVPGSRLGGVDVSGMEPAKVEKTAQELFDATVIYLKVDTMDPSKEPLETSVTPAEISMKLDAAATARKVMDKGAATNILLRYVPMNYKETAFVMTYSPTAIRRHLKETFPEAFTKPVDPEITYDEEKKSFTVSSGIKGLDLPEEEMYEIALGVARSPGNVKIDLKALVTYPLISDKAAREAADKADAMLEAELRFNTGGDADAKTAKTSKKNIAAMLEFITYDSTGLIEVNVSLEKARKYVKGPLTDRLGTSPVNIEAIEDGNGRVLLTTGVGKDGTKIADAAAVAEEIADALESGKALKLTVDLEVLEFGTVSVKPKSGEHWAEVNLTKQTTYFYEGSELVRTCVISSGTAQHRTRVGDFKVWLKVRRQNMKGGSKEDDTYYFTPNVEWISYFDREIAFHYAYWHNNFGRPMSHGCINMKEDDAIFSYDYLSNGDRVIVHY